jgi:hypothetical protein
MRRETIIFCPSPQETCFIDHRFATPKSEPNIPKGEDWLVAFGGSTRFLDVLPPKVNRWSDLSGIAFTGSGADWIFAFWFRLPVNYSLPNVVTVAYRL